MHPNGVRSNLRRMRDAGLVIHRRVGGPRGRPRDVWAISPTARPGGDPPHAYATLAVWLARTIPATRARLREVEAAGREIGHEFAARASMPPAEAVGDLLSALGFQPEIDHQPDGRLRCRLR